MKLLSELDIKKKARIVSLSQDNISITLMEMGCLPGEIVWIDHIALLGDPIAVYIAGYYLSLRINEACHIFVEEIN